MSLIAAMDFETYSPAGFVWNAETNKFDAPRGADKKGLKVVGAARYTEHPDADILCLAYNLGDGLGARLWTPSDSLPLDLFDHVQKGKLIEAWNVAFEYWVWQNIAGIKYKFPFLSSSQIRCAAAKSRASSLPGSLAQAGKVAGIVKAKDEGGKHLIKKFCIPRNPTKNNPKTRITHLDDPEDIQNLYNYCVRDIEAEAELSNMTPDLSEFEQKVFHCDHAINTRGVQIDVPLVRKCMDLLEGAYAKYNRELALLTRGAVESASKLPSLKKWLNAQGVPVDTLRAQDIKRLLTQDLPKHIKRALQIRDSIGSAAVKKLYSMSNQVCNDGRLHDLFIYHSAHTGRAAGTGPQPQNLPNSGPAVLVCNACDNHTGAEHTACLWCQDTTSGLTLVEWNTKAVADVIHLINLGSLELLELYMGDAVHIISSCLRGMFIAAPLHDLICSDYSAIEAVVLAALAREEWRLEVFRTHGKIYEMSASKITGIPFAEFEIYKKENGSHHPARSKIGKVAELASGFGGGLGAWRAFGAGEFFSDAEIQKTVKMWRNESPNIVNFWYAIERAAINAVGTPNVTYSHNGIKFICKNDALYCKLLSGRCLTYHEPILSPNGYDRLSLSYKGWNSNPAHGAIGWGRKDTYGGRLTENIIQATARDILAHAIVNLEERDYKIVLHIHDEIVVEMPENKGSIEELEKIMSTMPDWAQGWPVKASGGWRAKRYAK